MANNTILEAAAEIRQKRREVADLCQDLRMAEKEWTDYEMMADAALKGAEDAMRNAYSLMHSVLRMAQQRAKADAAA